MPSDDVVERVTAAINDYYLEHRANPRRITVSREMARELDAACGARKEEFGASGLLERPKLVADGHALWIRGILVVADIEAEDILDIRDEA